MYRYKHLKHCNGKSYGNIFDNPDQPIRKYKDINNEEEEQNENLLNKLNKLEAIGTACFGLKCLAAPL